MGSNRRSRQNQQHHQQQHQHRGPSDTSSWGGSAAGSHNNNNNNGDFYRQFSWALQEISTSNNVSGNNNDDNNSLSASHQLVLLVLGMTCMTIFFCSVVGVALGMTISVHYFESKSPVAVATGKLSPRDSYLLYSGLSAYQKVTTLDPTIAASNVITRENGSLLDLGKVITATDSGQLSVLMVVQEEPPLHLAGEEANDDTDNDDDNTTKDMNAATTTSSSPSSTSSYDIGIPLPMDQAEQLLPGYKHWKDSQPKLDLRQPTILPTLCSDGVTYGFDDWERLREAVQEANSISAERFMKWSEYFATNKFAAFADDSLYYEQDVVFTICPGAVLKGRQKGPIVINSENIVLECEHGCAIDSRGTHLAFGSNARNVLVRGITFKRASSSSLTFFHDGAEATFEDCTWVNNSGLNQKFGSVADINSTSIVNFFRCEIGFEKQFHFFGGVAAKSTSSLSIRSS